MSVGVYVVLRSRQQLDHIVVQLVWQRVLERREAVHHRRQVGVQLACSFNGEQHVFLAAGLGEPEPLIAARLLVDLDHARAVRLHPAHLTARIVLALDLGIHRRLLAAVEHVAGGVDAWAKQPPRFDHLGLFEDVERGRRRVVHRRDAVREVGRVFPLGLRQHLEARNSADARACRRDPAQWSCPRRPCASRRTES